VDRTLRFQVSGMSLFGCVERAKKSVRAVAADRGTESISVRDDAKQAGATVPACSSLVLNIRLSRHIAKVCKSVVSSIAIKVVDVTFGPLARDVQPCKPVLVTERCFYPHLSVSNPVYASCDLVFLDAIACAHSSRENTGARVVVEKFAKSLCRQIAHLTILHHWRFV
jgi:hypothetical protein